MALVDVAHKLKVSRIFTGDRRARSAEVRICVKRHGDNRSASGSLLWASPRCNEGFVVTTVSRSRYALRRDLDAGARLSEVCLTTANWSAKLANSLRLEWRPEPLIGVNQKADAFTFHGLEGVSCQFAKLPHSRLQICKKPSPKPDQRLKDSTKRAIAFLETSESLKRTFKAWT